MVSEDGGQEALQGVIIAATNMYDQIGGVLPSNRVTMIPSTLSVPAGENVSVTFRIDVTSIPPGYYIGSMVVRTENAGVHMIPLQITIEPLRVFLPLTLKN